MDDMTYFDAARGQRQRLAHHSASRPSRTRWICAWRISTTCRLVGRLTAEQADVLRETLRARSAGPLDAALSVGRRDRAGRHPAVRSPPVRAWLSCRSVPRNLRGVSGADLLQLHLAELEAARIQGLTQTIPVKQTVSLAGDFPVQFGQLKKTGACLFATSEEPLRLVYPGVYGYRVRNITVAANYAEPIQAHRGLFSNQGVSLVTRDKAGTAHTLVRYPDALPLSEFRMRNDMWVFDLPDETLLPFEGSGIETIWELSLSKIGNANGFESMTDMLITFDMRASYSAFLEKEHIAALPNSANRSVLVSANAMNPGALAEFRKHGGKVTLAFDLAKVARNANETARKTLNLVLVAVGVADAPFDATFSSAKPAKSEAITFEKGVALSNAGALADGNAGVPLPLNTFAGLDADQTFKLLIDANANPASNFTHLTDILLLAEYEATF